MLVEQTVANPGYVGLLHYFENAEEAQEIMQMAYHGDNLASAEESLTGN